MPVIGPSYSDKRVEEATKDVLSLLSEKYGIQKFPPEEMYRSNRLDRNRYLKFAIQMLFELESWESF